VNARLVLIAGAHIKSGYAEPAISWNDEADRQRELAKPVTAAMARAR
jgi:hypothetical protein